MKSKIEVMKSHFFTRNFIWLLILLFIVVSCQKDSSQVLDNENKPTLADIKELYAKKGIFKKINPKDNLPIQWEPLWDEVTVRKANDSVEYMFVPLHPFVKGDRKKKNEERGSSTYLLVKNGIEFYTGVYYSNNKEEIIDTRTFTGKMLFTNLKDGSAKLIHYKNGSQDIDAIIQKKKASSTKMGWEEQNCRTVLKDCTFKLVDYGCTGSLVTVRSMDCSYPGFCNQYYWEMIDSNEVTVCDNVWVPDAPDGGGGGNYTPSDEDKEIIDSLQGYPCAQAILVKLPNLKNKISEWLGNTFANTNQFNITFSASKTLSSSVDGEHYAANQNGSTQEIRLNGNMLLNASQEYIAATMFHEALHAFLHNEKDRLAKEGRPEQFGILYPGIIPTEIGNQTRFVLEHSTYGTLLEDLKMSIKSFNPNLSDYDAMALAKGGVVQNLNSVELSVNYANKQGTTGTKCP